MLQELVRSGGGPVSVRELAERQHVPYAFARAVQRDLLGVGFITTMRGAKGGAVLARDADTITLYDVVTAMQGAPSVSVCAHDPAWCEFSGGCSVHTVWCEADEMLREFLGSKTLAGLSVNERK
jgi:Rrf2 family protein